MRNPSAYITRAAKTKLRDEALKTWPSGGEDSEWWGKAKEETEEEGKEPDEEVAQGQGEEGENPDDDIEEDVMANRFSRDHEEERPEEDEWPEGDDDEGEW